jgi:hypothetical protein
MDSTDAIRMSCRINVNAYVLHQMNPLQKDALVTLLTNYKATEANLWWSVSLPTNYLEGSLVAGGNASNIYFGISPEGSVHT